MSVYTDIFSQNLVKLISCGCFEQKLTPTDDVSCLLQQPQWQCLECSSRLSPVMIFQVTLKNAMARLARSVTPRPQTLFTQVLRRHLFIQTDMQLKCWTEVVFFLLQKNQPTAVHISHGNALSVQQNISPPCGLSLITSAGMQDYIH